MWFPLRISNYEYALVLSSNLPPLTPPWQEGSFTEVLFSKIKKVWNVYSCTETLKY